MILRMMVGLSGPAYCLNPGDEREFPTEEAIRLISAGYAVAAGEKVETAVSVAPERRKRNVAKPRSH